MLPPNGRRERVMGAVFAIWALAAPAGEVGEAELKRETLEAWTRYVQATERRIEPELRSPRGFLALDFQPAGRAAEERRAVMSGEVAVESMETRNGDDREIDVPSGSIEHWRGAILVPGVTLAQVVEALRSGATLEGQPDVLESRILARDGDSMRTFLRLRRESIVTVTYATEHDVTIRRLSADRASSRSVATRIAEIENAGKPDEQEKPVGHDRGFLWRLNSYWRYEQTPAGVLIEVESLTLSRGVPMLLYPIARPIINRTARESIRTTLTALRATLSGGRGR